MAGMCYNRFMYNPNFSISSNINNLIAQIEGMRVKIDSASILPEQEIALRYKAAIESVHSSTSIEGNPLNQNEVKQALAGKLNHWERSVIEVTNYKRGWDWIISEAKKGQPVTLNKVLSLHRVVMEDLLPEGKVGHLRPGPVYIVDIEGKKEILRYTGPEVSKVKSLLSELFTWINQNPLKLHPVLLAGIFHYEFVSIHPFSDGNGRVTRLLVKLILDQAGYDFRGSLVLDKYYWQNQNKYYEALNRTNNYADQRIANQDPWLDYYVTGFYEVVKDLREQIDLLKHLDARQPAIRLNTEEIQIIDYIQQFGQVNKREVLGMFNISERTAERRLKGLVDRGFIEKKGEGKNTAYIRQKSK
jgi:Fic family protein